jgi:hypothetical protein
LRKSNASRPLPTPKRETPHSLPGFPEKSSSFSSRPRSRSFNRDRCKKTETEGADVHEDDNEHEDEHDSGMAEPGGDKRAECRCFHCPLTTRTKPRSWRSRAGYWGSMVAATPRVQSLKSCWREAFASDLCHSAQFCHFPLVLLQIFDQRLRAFAPSRCKLRKKGTRVPDRSGEHESFTAHYRGGHLFCNLDVAVCSTPIDRRGFLRFRTSQRMKKRKTSENVEGRRLVSGVGLFGHLPQYDRMRCCFRLGR